MGEINSADKALDVLIEAIMTAVDRRIEKAELRITKQLAKAKIGTDNIEARSIKDVHFADESISARKIKGDISTGGKSAYQIAVDGGYIGTEDQWIASLHGIGIAIGGNARQVLAKQSTSDYATEWVNAQLQYQSMPSVTADDLGQVAQYVGATGSGYTNGHVYKCISSGESTPTYSWSEIVYGDPNSVSYSAQTGKTESEKAQARANIGVADAGWALANETWEYVSVDDPTGVIKVQADVTGKYSVGMRVKMTNGGNAVYGIITVVSAYGGIQTGYTHISFLHEIDPADNLAKSLMANSVITANYYSSAKAPLGFPLNPANWSVVYSDSGTIRAQASATSNTWYELHTGIRPSVPIGLWIPKYSVKAQLNNSAAVSTTLTVTLSTSSATESSAINTASINGSSLANGCSQYVEKTLPPLSLSAKTTFYLNTKGVRGSGTMTIYNRADEVATIIRFTCAYL